MRKKLRWASIVAVAATFMTALLTTGGSGASAQDRVPLLIEPQAVVQFVTEPVIQPFPADTAETDFEDSADTDDDSDTAASLRELVSSQSAPAELSREMRCLAGAIYFEARGESLEGQLAVGRVIIQRAQSGRFPPSYCGVVFQRAQFSFVRGQNMPAIRENSQAWRNAVAVAQIAEEGSWDSPTEGALFFHASHVSPNWRLKRLARVDNHIFYR